MAASLLLLGALHFLPLGAGASFLCPTREEYKGHPTVTGTWSLDPVTGDLRLLQHAPSGVFNPLIDSFGRLIVTRWDHFQTLGQGAQSYIPQASPNLLTWQNMSANTTDATGLFLWSLPLRRGAISNFAHSDLFRISGFFASVFIRAIRG